MLGVDGEEIRGRVVSVSPDKLTLDIGGTQTTIAPGATARIQRRDSVRNGAWIGAIAGAAVGVASGAALYSLCANEGGDCGGGLALMGALSIGSGALIGAGFDGLRHKVIFDSGRDLRFANDIRQELFGSLALGRVTSFGSANTTANMGAGWGAHFANGLAGVRVRCHTIGWHEPQYRVLRQTRIRPEQSVPGRGHSHTRVSNGRLGEAVVRVHAHVAHSTICHRRCWRCHLPGKKAGALRFSRAEPFSSFDPTRSVVIYDSGYGDDGLVGSVGGGIRVRLTRALAICGPN